MKDIRNFAQLTPEIATSGQPTEEQLRNIANAGYGVVIDMSTQSHDDALHNEKELVEGLGMKFFHIPVPFDDPKPDHFTTFRDVVSAHESGKVWVHCTMNYRVSVFMFHYLTKVKGMSAKEARSPIFQRWQPDAIWMKYLRLTADDFGM